MLSIVPSVVADHLSVYEEVLEETEGASIWCVVKAEAHVEIRDPPEDVSRAQHEEDPTLGGRCDLGLITFTPFATESSEGPLPQNNDYDSMCAAGAVAIGCVEVNGTVIGHADFCDFGTDSDGDYFECGVIHKARATASNWLGPGLLRLFVDDDGDGLNDRIEGECTWTGLLDEETQLDDGCSVVGYDGDQMTLREEPGHRTKCQETWFEANANGYAPRIRLGGCYTWVKGSTPEFIEPEEE